MDDALAFAADWYARRDLPLRLRVVEGSSVDQELGRRGWGAQWQTSMQTATVALMRRRLNETLSPPAPRRRRFQRSHRRRGCSVSARAPSRRPLSMFYRWRRGAPSPRSGPAPGRATAIGRASVELPWVGFAAIEVDPGVRRQGHARAVMSALLDWAAERGALRAWLEVLADNDAAFDLYASMGFAEHYRYCYRVPPSA